MTSVLTITNVWKEDVALYTCVATNMVGEARTSAQLNMDQAPPMVTIPLEKCIEVDEGEPLEIKVGFAFARSVVSWSRVGGFDTAKVAS